MIHPQLLPFEVEKTLTTRCGAADYLFVFPRVRKNKAQTPDVMQKADRERSFCEHFAGFGDVFGKDRRSHGMPPATFEFFTICGSLGIGGGRVHGRNLARAIESD